MSKSRFVAAVAAATISLGMLAAPAFATTMAKPMAPVTMKHKHHYVSGKVVHVSYKHSTITLKVGKTDKTYKVAHVHAYKVGHWARVRIS